MLNVSGTTRVLVATTPVDLRGSFNRLFGVVVRQFWRRRVRILIHIWRGVVSIQ
jgi:hypothetical protein